MKHANIALFVPHIGCPNQCSFCNQRSISGQQTLLTPDDVKQACQQALEQGMAHYQDTQLAFFGGSFTAIDREYMVSLLEAAQPFLKNGLISGIRLSTRPDAIDSEILELLLKYGVSAIELGVQSMDDEVLIANQRGHTSDDVRIACSMIKSYGIELGLQMMTGLYQDTPEKDRDTALEIAALKPATVRIYPTILIKGTPLERLYLAGLYAPQSLEDAVELCSSLLEIFHNEKIRVIRLGLHASTFLEKDILGGPYHPAFRELCESRIYRKKAIAQLQGLEGKSAILYVQPSALSKMIGQKKSNLLALQSLGYSVMVKPKDNMEEYQIHVSSDVQK